MAARQLLSSSRGTFAGPVVLAAAALVLWGIGVVISVSNARRQDAARCGGAEVERMQQVARQLLTARSQGRAVARPMSRREAASWAYWETVARKSGVSADSFAIEPSFSEPTDGTSGPVLLSTTVTLESVTLQHLLTFLFHITDERPYVGISSMQATKVRSNLWDASIETRLCFEETQERFR